MLQLSDIGFRGKPWKSVTASSFFSQIILEKVVDWAELFSSLRCSKVSGFIFITDLQCSVFKHFVHFTVQKHFCLRCLVKSFWCICVSPILVMNLEHYSHSSSVLYQLSQRIWRFRWLKGLKTNYVYCGGPWSMVFHLCLSGFKSHLCYNHFWE